jgi:hypothetical protein
MYLSVENVSNKNVGIPLGMPLSVKTGGNTRSTERRIPTECGIRCNDVFLPKEAILWIAFCRKEVNIQKMPTKLLCTHKRYVENESRLCYTQQRETNVVSEQV